MSVDFPAPFSPAIACTEPFSMASETSCRASCPPKRLLMPRTSSAGTPGTSSLTKVGCFSRAVPPALSRAPRAQGRPGPLRSPRLRVSRAAYAARLRRPLEVVVHQLLGGSRVVCGDRVRDRLVLLHRRLPRILGQLDDALVEDRVDVAENPAEDSVVGARPDHREMELAVELEEVIRVIRPPLLARRARDPLEPLAILVARPRRGMGRSSGLEELADL